VAKVDRKKGSLQSIAWLKRLLISILFPTRPASGRRRLPR
jgi:hypothetical protein